LRLAALNAIRSIAFPSISTGAYAYPLKPATEIALATTRRVIAAEGGPEEIVFCCFSGEDYATYARALRAQKT
jgi:O-acetyl-ADP-ribose deacetylase (regulator of RNase III)